MPLVPSAMAAAITAAQGPAEDTAKQDEANLKIATGICTYLTASLVVQVTTVDTGTVTTGVGAGGVVAATGTGTGTVL